MWIKRITTHPVCIIAACLAIQFAQCARADETAGPVRVSISTEKADVRTVLSDLFRKVHANFVLDSGVKGEVDIDVKDEPFDRALRDVLDAVQGGPALEYSNDSGIYRVTLKKGLAEKKEIPNPPAKRDSKAGLVLEGAAPEPDVPATEWYVVPTPPVLLGRGIRPSVIAQDDTALYVRVDHVPADPLWLPVGATLPAVPVWMGDTRALVQTELGPRPPDAIGGGIVIQPSVGLRVTASSHLPGAPGGRWRAGGHFPSWRF